MKRKPLFEWNQSGQAFEVKVRVVKCHNRSEHLGTDEYGASIRCSECGGYRNHQSMSRTEFIRRPEYDAPRPGSLDPKPLSDQIGEALAGYGEAE